MSLELDAVLPPLPQGTRFFQPPPDWFVKVDQPLQKHRGRLPHWQQGPVLYCLTWRLADSLPQEKLIQWRAERDRWLRHHPGPWDWKIEREYSRRFTKQIELWLDAGEGSCVLRDAALSQMVAQALHHFDGQRCDLCGYVIMPNHVHGVVRLRPGVLLENLVKSWKGYTGFRINQHLGRSGVLWEEEYWDRLIRDGDHYGACLEYLLNNPVRARLKRGEYVLWIRCEGDEHYAIS